jgi:Alpha amylase, catalytic domain
VRSQTRSRAVEPRTTSSGSKSSSDEPLFGSLAEAEKLIAEAHALGMRIIIDIVPNHGSDQQQWFADALAAPAGSAERARYHFRPGRGSAGAGCLEVGWSPVVRRPVVRV